MHLPAPSISLALFLVAAIGTLTACTMAKAESTAGGDSFQSMKPLAAKSVSSIAADHPPIESSPRLVAPVPKAVHFKHGMPDRRGTACWVVFASSSRAGDKQPLYSKPMPHDGNDGSTQLFHPEFQHRFCERQMGDGIGAVPITMVSSQSCFDYQVGDYEGPMDDDDERPVSFGGVLTRPFVAHHPQVTDFANFVSGNSAFDPVSNGVPASKANAAIDNFAQAFGVVACSFEGFDHSPTTTTSSSSSSCDLEFATALAASYESNPLLPSIIDEQTTSAVTPPPPSTLAIPPSSRNDNDPLSVESKPSEPAHVSKETIVPTIVPKATNRQPIMEVLPLVSSNRYIFPIIEEADVSFGSRSSSRQSARSEAASKSHVPRDREQTSRTDGGVEILLSSGMLSSTTSHSCSEPSDANSVQHGGEHQKDSAATIPLADHQEQLAASGAEDEDGNSSAEEYCGSSVDHSQQNTAIVSDPSRCFKSATVDSPSDQLSSRKGPVPHLSSQITKFEKMLLPSSDGESHADLMHGCGLMMDLLSRAYFDQQVCSFKDVEADSMALISIDKSVQYNTAEQFLFRAVIQNNFDAVQLLFGVKLRNFISMQSLLESMLVSVNCSRTTMLQFLMTQVQGGLPALFQELYQHVSHPVFVKKFPHLLIDSDVFRITSQLDSSRRL